MEWLIKIEKQPKKRILVAFDPEGEIITFKGQCKMSTKDYVRSNAESLWVDFSHEVHPMAITLEDIQKIIVRVYDKMNERLVVHEDLTKSFAILGEIELKTD